MFRFTALMLSLGLCPSVLGPSLLAQRPLPPDRRAGADAITETDLRQWVGTLASEEFEGRGTGQEGFRKAAEYVRDHFESLGLRPGAPDGSYWQRVPWEAITPDVGASQLVVRRDGRDVLQLDGRSGLSGRVSGALRRSGPLTLLVVSDEQTPELTDLDGRIALIYARPASGSGANDASARRGGRRGRRGGGTGRLLAAATGAGAELAISVTETAGQGLTGTRGARTGNRVGPSQISIGKADLERLLGVAGVDPAVLAGDRMRHDLTGLSAELTLVTEEEELPAWNVVGILPGSDPDLRDEYVVIGSHLDHSGRRGDTIYPGADDDASGSAGVMALARALSSNPVKPRRSILFVAFCGEENGLIGSGYFAENCPIPLSSIVGELQMDMIGRNEGLYRGSDERPEDNVNSLHLVGTEKLSRDLHALCMSRNEEFAGFDLEFDEEDVFFRSDHANFAKYGVPIAFFFTGFHPDYHRPTDTPDKIDYDKLGRVVRYVYDIAFELAQADDRPLIDAELWEANRAGLRSPVEVPAAPVRRR